MGRTIVEFKIDPKYNVPNNTLAKLVSTDLLGTKAIVFEMGNSKIFAEDKDTLKADIQGSLARKPAADTKESRTPDFKMDSSLARLTKY